MWNALKAPFVWLFGIVKLIIDSLVDILIKYPKEFIRKQYIMMTETFQGPAGKGSSKKYTKFAAFFVCVIMWLLEQVYGYTANEYMFWGFLVAAVGETVLGVIDAMVALRTGVPRTEKVENTEEDEEIKSEKLNS